MSRKNDFEHDDNYDYGPGIGGEIDDGMDDLTYGTGIDAGIDNSLDNLKYEDCMNGFSHSYDDTPNFDADTERKQEDNYNFGYGGNRHNRESGSRFYGLGRWRYRG